MYRDLLRISIIRSIVGRRSGHLCSSLSAIDIIAAILLESPWLSFGVGGNAHFILSKGHAAPALYAVLAARGDILEFDLTTLRRLGSALEGHPRRHTIPAIEVTTGSLGQGLSYAVGLAVGLTKQGLDHTVICVASDGELQAGICYESLAIARQQMAKNLIVVIDFNGWQTDGPISEIHGGDIEKLINSLGIECRHANGHDRASLTECIKSALGVGPLCIIAKTRRGYGVPWLSEDELYGENISDDLARQLLAWCEG